MYKFILSFFKHFTAPNIIGSLISLIIVGLFRFSPLPQEILTFLGIYPTEVNSCILSGFLALVTRLGINGVVEDFITPYLEIFINKMKISDILDGPPGPNRSPPSQPGPSTGGSQPRPNPGPPSQPGPSTGGSQPRPSTGGSQPRPNPGFPSQPGPSTGRSQHPPNPAFPGQYGEFRFNPYPPRQPGGRVLTDSTRFRNEPRTISSPIPPRPPHPLIGPGYGVQMIGNGSQTSHSGSSQLNQQRLSENSYVNSPLSLDEQEILAEKGYFISEDKGVFVHDPSNVRRSPLIKYEGDRRLISTKSSQPYASNLASAMEAYQGSSRYLRSCEG